MACHPLQLGQLDLPRPDLFSALARRSGPPFSLELELERPATTALNRLAAHLWAVGSGSQAFQVGRLASIPGLLPLGAF